MSLLDNITIDESIENEKDSVGGGGLLDSALYSMKIALAYLRKSEGGALALVAHFKTDEGRELRQSFWVTSGDAKGNKNYYEREGEKFYLPGFNLANSLCLLTVGKNLNELVPETKVIPLWNSEKQAEEPTEAPVLTELLDKEIIAGVLRQKVNKNTKTDAGYVPSDEIREENEIDKFFRARDKMTTAEIRAQAEEAVFHETWANKRTGVTRDRSTKGGVSSGAQKSDALSGNSSKPQKSLFN